MKFSKLTKQPRKKRKAFYNAALHELQKLVAVHVSKQLKKTGSVKKRALPVKTGDKVRVVSGKFLKREGRVVRVDLKKTRVFVEGIIAKKQGGKEVLVPLHPSNLMLIELTQRN